MGRRLRLLLVEDSRGDARLIELRLEEAGFEVEKELVETGEELRDALTRESWDLVVTDYMLPGFSGLEALRIVRETAPEVPALVVSGAVGEDTAIEAMVAGAADYVMKDRLSKLVPAVERALREAEVRRGRRLAEEALRESEEQKRSILNAVREIIFTFAEDGETITSLNPAFDTTLGFPVEEWIGRSWRPLVRPEDQGRMADWVGVALAGRNPPPFEVRLIGRGEEEILVEVVCVPLRELGSVAGVSGTVRDVTERHRVEEARRRRTEETIRHQTALLELTKEETADLASILRQITERTARTLDVRRVGVWLFDGSRMQARCEDSFDLDTARHEVGEVLRREEVPRYFEALEESRVIDARDARVDIRTADLTGGYLVRHGIGSILAVPVRVQGRPAGYLCAEHAGELRQWSDGEQEFAASLADMMSARLAAEERRSAEERLVRAQRLEALGTLASGVAHDLNNILTPILTAVHSLRLGLPAEELDEVLTAVEAHTRRAADIVSQVLTFGRGVGGARVGIEPGELCSEVATIARTSFPKNVDVREDIADGLWGVTGDSTQLHQVLLNLAINARDAMPDGGTLTLEAANAVLDALPPTAAADAPPGRYVVIGVRDSGTGIPPEVREKVFDPFFTTKPPGKGTGLGLSTALGIVRSHHGFIDVESEPGKGTLFRIFLPAAIPETAGGPGASASGGGRCVLVAEDEPGVRDMVRRVLEGHGYRVLLAADGAEAIERYRETPGSVDAVFTDVVMPSMSGVALVKELRSLDGKVPVLAATGVASQEDLDELARLGVARVLRKPYAAGDLLAALGEVLSTRRAS